MNLPTDSAIRKDTPLYSGVFKYFPLALAAVARVSKAGNDKHNPGQPIHWSRGKSDDHLDSASRHMTECGTFDTDGELHDAHLAWRALANLQLMEEGRVRAPASNTTVGDTPDQMSFMWGEPPPVERAPVLEPGWLIEGNKATPLHKPPFTFWYLATPYSEYPYGHDAAATLAAMMAARLAEARIPVFSPIAHSHPIAKHTAAHSTDHDFWMNVDAPFMELASGLIVVTAESWQQSRGIQEEIKRFAEAGKPIIYWDLHGRIPKSVRGTAR